MALLTLLIIVGCSSEPAEPPKREHIIPSFTSLCQIEDPFEGVVTTVKLRNYDAETEIFNSFSAYFDEISPREREIYGSGYPPYNKYVRATNYILYPSDSEYDNNPDDSNWTFRNDNEEYKDKWGYLITDTEFISKETLGDSGRYSKEKCQPISVDEFNKLKAKYIKEDKVGKAKYPKLYRDGYWREGID